MRFWFHIVTLLTKVTDPDQREWYAIRAAERAWSRATLQANIKAQLHLREGGAVTNFAQRLPEPQVVPRTRSRRGRLGCGGWSVRRSHPSI